MDIGTTHQRRRQHVAGLALYLELSLQVLLGVLSVQWSSAFSIAMLPITICSLLQLLRNNSIRVQDKCRDKQMLINKLPVLVFLQHAIDESFPIKLIEFLSRS